MHVHNQFDDCLPEFLFANVDASISVLNEFSSRAVCLHGSEVVLSRIMCLG